MATLKIGAVLALALEQVHFAASDARDLPIVKGNPHLTSTIQALARGDVSECMRQGPNVRQLLGLANSATVVVPGADDAGKQALRNSIRVSNLAGAMQRLGIENTLFGMLRHENVLSHDQMQIWSNAFDYLITDGYIANITELLDPAEHTGDWTLDPSLAGDNVSLVKHEASQCTFAIKTCPDGSGIVSEVEVNLKTGEVRPLAG